MFNPLTENLTLLSDEELTKKINELTKKFYQTQNPTVQNQISLFIDMYKYEQFERSRKQINADNNNPDLDNLININ
jgi:hypothetical protein